MKGTEGAFPSYDGLGCGAIPSLSRCPGQCSRAEEIFTRFLVCDPEATASGWIELPAARSHQLLGETETHTRGRCGRSTQERCLAPRRRGRLRAMMQEFQSVPGLAGRLFGGAGASSDLRRAHHQQGPGARCGGVLAPPEAVKCPRCESTNTKFCYYNNYNLSQPRHFCKSCRRYWTKGGVLRNVPVGGGCRKTKRSSSSPSTPAPTEAAKNPRRASASSPRSATDSGGTSPTAAAATPSSNNVASVIAGQGAAISNPFSSSSSSVDVAPPAPIFADQAAALASLFAAPPPPPLPVFSFMAAQPKEEGVSSSSPVVLLAGHAAPQDEPTNADMVPFTSLDDAGIFEQLGDASAAAAYWNAGSCWTDVQDPSVYLP